MKWPRALWKWAWPFLSKKRQGSRAVTNEYGVAETVTIEDDKIVKSRSQDVTGMLDYIKEFAEVAPSMHGDAAWRFVGRIPVVVMEQWIKECGAKFGSQELNEYIRKKLMSGEFSKLVVKGY
jgi:hypothetical protein